MRKVILNEKEIELACQQIANEITNKVKGEEKIPLMVGVMKGAMNFMITVMKYMDIPLFTDFIQISSYFGLKRTNNVRLLKDVSYDCNDRTVIIVEDVVDTGYSMKYLVEHLYTLGAKKVYVATLVDKRCAREVEVPVDFVGYTMDENRFIVGFGLDYCELGRNIPYIFEIEPDEVNRLDMLLEKDRQ